MWNIYEWDRIFSEKRKELILLCILYSTEWWKELQTRMELNEVQKKCTLIYKNKYIISSIFKRTQRKTFFHKNIKWHNFFNIDNNKKIFKNIFKYIKIEISYFKLLYIFYIIINFVLFTYMTCKSVKKKRLVIYLYLASHNFCILVLKYLLVFSCGIFFVCF